MYRSLYDSSVYFNKLLSGEYIYLLLYVDDMFIVSTNRSSIDKLKIQLSLEFEMKDLGEEKRILGMEIEKDRVKGKVKLRKHIARRFYRSSMLDVNQVCEYSFGPSFQAFI